MRLEGEPGPAGEGLYAHAGLLTLPMYGTEALGEDIEVFDQWTNLIGAVGDRLVRRPSGGP